MIKKHKITKNVIMKEVTLRDTSYILKLRTNKILSKYINPTSSNKNTQILWMKKYFIRRKKKKEFYFIFQKKKFKNFGIGRIIHLKKDIFHFGGWVLNTKSSPSLALESCLSIYEYAFNNLKYKKTILWINLHNKKVINFHKNLGAKPFKKTKTELFLNFNKDDYKKVKKKFIYFF